MKIVYILKSYALKAGTERVMSEKMNYLVEHGYEVILVTYEQGEHPLAFPINSSIRHIDLNTRFFEIEKLSILRRIPLLQRMRRLFRTRLQTVLDEIHPDFVITTSYSLKILDIILLARTHACRIVESHAPCFTIRKSYIHRDKPLLYYALIFYDKWMLSKVSKADQLVVLTEGDAKEWKKYTTKITVIPNPITTFPDSVKQHDGTNKRIICVGRLHKEKRWDMVIDAFSQIAGEGSDWNLDIVGDGAERSNLLNQIQRYNLLDRISIKSSVSNIYAEYQNSDFCVLCSKYEGFGLVLIEAMSCGIPCISFRCKYGPENIIDDGKDGLLVEDGNVKELTEKMHWMMTHTKERLQMGLKARENVRRFKQIQVMSQWTDLFDKML